MKTRGNTLRWVVHILMLIALGAVIGYVSLCIKSGALKGILP
jgi:hypothetical protein